MSRLSRRYAPLVAALTVSLAFCTVASAQDTPKPYLTLDALRAKYGDRAGHIAKIDGVEVYYKDEGKGPALLMVHGSESNQHTYDRIVAKLKGRYRIIRFDIPPQGLSGPVSDEVAAKLVAADIPSKLLDQLGVKKVTFVGVSSGGTMGVFLTAKRPDLVQRLIIANAPSNPVTTGHMVPSPELAKEQEEAKRVGFKSRAFWEAFLSYFAGDPARISTATRDQYYDMGRRKPEPHMISLVAQVGDREKALAAMEKVTIPTLLVWGARDALLTPSSADVLASYLKNAQVSKILLPDVGHYPPLEVPERFADIIATYIEDMTPGAGETPKK